MSPGADGTAHAYGNDNVRTGFWALVGLIAAAKLACGAVNAAQAAMRFGTSNIDRSANACDDFYQYACGGWLAANPRPDDQIWWGSFEIMQRRNDEILRDIVAKASAGTSKRGTNERLLGDYYVACMDEPAIEADGLAPIKPELDRIAAITHKSELAAELARLHLSLYLPLQGGTFPSIADAGSHEPLFGFYASQDFADASKVVAFVDQGGLGLPDRDYYLRDSASARQMRQQYVRHIATLFKLAHAEQAPEQAARTVLELETLLARSSMDAASRTDRNHLNHPVSQRELEELMPTFNWQEYLAASGAPTSAHYLLAHPAFFKGVERLLATRSLDDWKLYFKWQLLNAAAPMLSAAFVREDFEFNQKALLGTERLRARSTTCLRALDRDLPDALGEAFVTATFKPADRQQVLGMASAIQAAMRKVILTSTWIGESTRREALAKIDSVRIRIGNADKWRDYSTLPVTRHGWLSNAFAASEHELNAQLQKIGQPPDRDEWWMSPTTIDAHYNPRQNTVSIPAANLAPPFFDRDMDPAVNFCDIGSLIGHELTHGFDTMGRHYNHEGSLSEWWTAAEARDFNQRAQCVADQYSRYVAVDDVRLNGELTSAENIADAGGLRIALMAFHETRKSSQPAARADGFTDEQRFFLSYALHWCTNATPASLRDAASSDFHSPPKFRVNGVVSDMPEFQKAFACHKGQAMVHAPACRVW